MLLGPSAPAELLIEHFSYNNGSLGSAGIGSSVWTDGDSASSAISVNSAAALTHPSLTGITGSGIVFTGGTFKKKAAPFTAQSSGPVYCSFLLSIQAIGGTTKAFVYLQNGNSASSSPPLGIFLDSGSHIGIGKSVSSPGASTAAGLGAGTHFIVARYSFQDGNDQVDLWLDPTSLGDNGNIPAVTLTSGTGSSSDAAALSYVFLNHAVSQTLWIDEVRVGTTWADVTPTSTPPPMPTNVVAMTQAFLDLAGFVIRGSGGTSTGFYFVVSAPDLTTNVSNWSVIATNVFDVSGNFDCTNPVPSEDSQRFYAVHDVGGNLPPPPGEGSTNVFPVNGATNICVDTPLQIIFDSVPTLGASGQIRVYNASSPGSPVDTIDLSLSSQSKTFGGTSLHYSPVLIDGTAAFISLHSALAYGQIYYVNVDSNAFHNVTSWAGITGVNSWRFTTKPAAPASTSTNIVVAADGSGDFCTVQGAIDFVPSGNTTPRMIHIQNGVYREIVRNNSRNNLTFLGQDRNQTVFVYANNENMNSGSASRSMFSTSGNDITMKNLKLVNSTPQGGSQAEALKVAGLRFIFWNGELDSLQDTIMVSNSGDQAYFQDSLVQGNVDYVWGSGTIYFNNCEIRSVYRGSSPNGYICQPRNDAAHNGIAFVDCQVTGTGGSFNTQYLARNNSKDSTPASQTVFINCMMSTNINPVGWFLDGSSSPTNLRFWEYQSTDLNTNLLDVSQWPSWSRQLTAPEAADVRDLSTWFSGWVPQVTP